jgi:hypothetical protein
LNPAERVTARFKCKKCSMVERKYSQDGVFFRSDFGLPFY